MQQNLSFKATPSPIMRALKLKAKEKQSILQKQEQSAH